MKLCWIRPSKLAWNCGSRRRALPPQAVGVGEQAAGNVERSGQRRQQGDGQPGQHGVLVGRQAPVPHDRRWSVRQGLAVDLDGGADLGRLAVLVGEADHGGRRHRGDVLDHLGRVPAHVVGQALEPGPGLDAIDGVRAGEREVADIGVERFGAAVGGVPHHGLARAGFPQVEAVGAHEVRAVGHVLHELLVVEVQLVHELVDHAQQQGGVGSGPDRYPFLGSRRGGAADRVDRHDVEVSRPALGEGSGGVHRVVVHDGSELRPEEHDVPGVHGIGHALERALVHVADAVHVVAAEDLRRPRREPR